MTDDELRGLARLLRSRRLAALGTLHADGPQVSMALYAPGPDLTEYYLHLSRLAVHTQDLRANAACGLMVAEAETETRNPLTLGRVSLQGEAQPLAAESPDFAAAQALYLERYPFAAINFSLPDFSLYAFRPRAGRYVAGFGKIFDLGLDDLRRAAG